MFYIIINYKGGSMKGQWGRMPASHAVSFGDVLCKVKMITSQSAVMLCGGGVKAGMVHSTCG